MNFGAGRQRSGAVKDDQSVATIPETNSPVGGLNCPRVTDLFGKRLELACKVKQGRKACPYKALGDAEKTQRRKETTQLVCIERVYPIR